MLHPYPLRVDATYEKCRINFERYVIKPRKRCRSSLLAALVMASFTARVFLCMASTPGLLEYALDKQFAVF